MRRVLLLTSFAIACLMALTGSRVRTGDRSSESAAIAAIKSIHAAQVLYLSRHGSSAGTLADLKPFVDDPDVSTGKQDGYRFRMNAGPVFYEIYAQPDSGRSFYSDQSMVIRVSDGPEPANANSRELR